MPGHNIGLGRVKPLARHASRLEMKGTIREDVTEISTHSQQPSHQPCPDTKRRIDTEGIP